MVKVDLKDVYFTVPIHVAHQPILRFQVELEHLPVHIPAFRPVMCTLGIHQSNETSVHPPLEHGSPHDYYIDNILLMAELQNR